MQSGDTMGSRTVRNVVWNFAGQGIPMAVALFTIPFLIARLGTDRFGLLSIGWVLIGYLSVFDLGLGRAMTRQVAIKLGLGKADDIPVVFWTTICAMMVLGVTAAAAGLVLSGALVSQALRLPAGLEPEAHRAFMVLSLGIPVTILSSGLLGLLEAYQRFRIVGLLRMAAGLAAYGVPAAVALSTRDIVAVVAALVGARVVISMAGLVACMAMSRSLRRPSRPERGVLRDLLRVGGWLTVSNTVSPIMASLDRFLLGALISVGAITYYITPADALTKATVIPVAVTGVLFPIFTGVVTGDRGRTLDMFRRGWDSVFLLLLPFVLAVVVFAQPALTLWIDAEFAERSKEIATWLAFGVLANGLAQMPYALLQATSKAKQVALIHLMELPLYVVTLWLLVEMFGILGAAIAWTLRMVVDLVALLWASSGLAGGYGALVSPIWRIEAGLVLYALVLALVRMPPGPGAIAVVLGGGVCATLLLTRTGLGSVALTLTQSRSPDGRGAPP